MNTIVNTIGRDISMEINEVHISIVMLYKTSVVVSTNSGST